MNDNTSSEPARKLNIPFLLDQVDKTTPQSTFGRTLSQSGHERDIEIKRRKEILKGLEKRELNGEFAEIDGILKNLSKTLWSSVGNTEGTMNIRILFKRDRSHEGRCVSFDDYENWNYPLFAMTGRLTELPTFITAIKSISQIGLTDNELATLKNWGFALQFEVVDNYYIFPNEWHEFSETTAKNIASICSTKIEGGRANSPEIAIEKGKEHRKRLLKKMLMNVKRAKHHFKDFEEELKNEIANI